MNSLEAENYASIDLPVGFPKVFKNREGIVLSIGFMISVQV
jgi:hypothetical protein